MTLMFFTTLLASALLSILLLEITDLHQGISISTDRHKMASSILSRFLTILQVPFTTYTTLSGAGLVKSLEEEFLADTNLTKMIQKS